MKRIKKESKESEEGQSLDYVVGSVSGSLFLKQSASSSRLSGLFQAAPVVDTRLFVPAPKSEPRSVEVKEEGLKKTKGQQQKKVAKHKSAADVMLESRECALQNADEEEALKTHKKTKRRAVKMGEEGASEDLTRQTKKPRTAAEMAEERIKLKRTVFVGNLPASCTKNRLQLVFKGYGDIETIRFRSMVREDPAMPLKTATIQRKVHPKKQNINAYVVFKHKEGAEKALERNGMEIEKNFHIRVDKVANISSHDHKRSIFIGNLPFEISELPVRQHFEDCGKIDAVRLVRDKNSGLGKGFGYILFESIDAVQLALKLDGSKLLDRPIRVKRSVKKEKVKKGAPRFLREKGPKKNTNRMEGTQTKGDFKGRPVPSGPQSRSLGRQLGKGPQNKMGRQFKRTPGKSPNATSSHSFQGEMADLNRKAKVKAQKNKRKPRR
ncbi:hypothetical protein UPYG_G00068370 [Umbra pygmaea]|uniref:RRM domain-containing protein n=1 Tax=Umbra pygmaea TaxID=75934 RepID=A0ABD0XB89_UMBPY